MVPRMTRMGILTDEEPSIRFLRILWIVVFEREDHVVVEVGFKFWICFQITITP